MGGKIKLKSHNRKSVYRLVYNSEGISKQEIAVRLKLSLPTVSQNLSELKEKGLIEEDGTFESTGGRRAKVIKSINDVKTAIGMDITRNHVSLVMLDLKGKVLYSVRKRIVYEDTDAYYNTVEETVNKFVEMSKIPEDRILGMGVSLPAIIGHDRESISYISVLPAPYNLYDKLCEHFNYKIVLANDANAGGFAEFWRRDSANPIVYISLSNSVGGAIMYSREAYYGENHRSGEFGHITLVPDGKQCYCGQKGCADAYCNAKVLSDLTDGNLSSFFKELESGNKECEKVFDQYIYYLGQLVNNLRMTFDCDVVLGGYVGSYMEKHINKLTETVNKRNAFDQNGDYIKVCNYKFEASAAGAALYFIDRFIESV